MNSTKLKTQTQDLHDSIEKVMHSSLLFSNKFTADHYKNFLRKSYTYIAAIAPSSTLHWPEYSVILSTKKEALHADLVFLGVPTEANATVTLADTDKYHTLGLFYIVLGAMLGNKMILKKLKEYESFQNSTFNYLATQQEQLPTLWKHFQSKINELEADQLEEVISGARDGYKMFGA